jgi:adenylate cyclase
MPGVRYTFEDWTLDCVRGELISAQGNIVLRPKSFEVLKFLLQNAGRLISRDEVLTSVWSGVTVTEESLTQCVSEIRQALGDAEQRIIKTVPKRGYLVSVAVRTASSDAQDGEFDRYRIKQPVAAQSDSPSLAVLPFTNLSGDPSQEYISDGITEDVINGLSYFSDLSVIASNSSFSYKNRSIDVREIGRDLGARYIVEGSVRRMGGRIRITAQLVDAHTGIRRWAERFDRPLEDVFAVQDDIARSIIRIVVAHVGHAEVERVSRKPPNSWTAYDLMMQGDQAQRALDQSWNSQYLREARQFFAEALKVDPGNARICAKLGHTYVRAYADPAGPDLGNRQELERGYALALRSVALDPNLPLARAQLGWAYFWMNQLDAAIEQFEKAVALNPNFTDYRFSAILVFVGQPERALEVLHAHVRLDPFHPPALHAIQGHALFMLKRYPEAVAALRECIRRAPHIVFAQVWLAAALVAIGQRTEAQDTIAEVLRRFPNLTTENWPVFSLYRHAHDSAHMNEAVRAAGFA